MTLPLPAEAPGPRWPSSSGEAGLRAVSVYFAVVLLPGPLALLPVIGPPVDEAFAVLWSTIASALGLEPIAGGLLNGVGTEEVAQVLVGGTLALVVAGVSMLIRSPSRAGFSGGIEAVGRLALASALLHYGLNKVPPAQFSLPALQQLVQPVGELNKMELLWTFIGASPAYEVFSGVLELVAAALLCGRKTRLAGALLAMAVLANVTMLNVCYDVIAKAYATQLLVLAVALCVPHRKRLLGLFTGQAVAADDAAPLFASRSKRRAVVVVVVAWLLVSTGYVIAGVDRSYHQMGNGRRRPALYGIYRVDAFFEDGRERPASLADPSRWRLFIIDRALPMDMGVWGVRSGEVWTVATDGTRQRRFVKVDEATSRISLLPVPGQTGDSALTFQKTPEGWRADGRVDGHDVGLVLTPVDHTQMPLLQPTQGFDL